MALTGSNRRIVLFHNMVAPYRHALFAALAQRIDLTVLYSTRATKDRHWNTQIPDTYRAKVLQSVVVYWHGRPMIVCRDLYRQLDFEQPSAVISVLTRSNIVDVLKLSSYARRRRIALLLWIGDVERAAYRDDVPAMLDGFWEWYFKRAIRAASGFLYYSSLSRKWAERRGAQGPCMVGTQVLSPPTSAPRIRIGAERSGTPVRLLFVGKMEERKGLDILIGALQRLAGLNGSAVDLVCAGDGPMLPLLLGSAPEHVRFQWLGHVDREQLWEEYREADCLVLPTRHDPWGFVTNESMSAGTPVLATKQAGSCELASRAGWAADCRDPDGFAATLARALAECRDERRRDRAAAAEAEYRPDPCAERIADLVEEALRVQAELRPSIPPTVA
jgi:glycosyltransferase involved in cell wall biosynthesis